MRASDLGLDPVHWTYDLVPDGPGQSIKEGRLAMADAKKDAVDVRKLDAQTLQMGAPDRIDREQLRGITSFDDAVKLSAEVHGAVQDYAEEYGSGFDVVDKSIFVNKTIAILEWRFASGDYGGETAKFVIATVVAKDDSKGIITDGSTGLCEQLLRISADEGRYGGLIVRKGLRESTYDICSNCGAPRKETVLQCETCGDESKTRNTGRTFYLDESLS